MRNGHPEGADSTFARRSHIFIASTSTLSETNVRQLQEQGIEWVELQKPNGFRKFEDVLNNLDIPHESFDATVVLDRLIDDSLSEIFP